MTYEDLIVAIDNDTKHLPGCALRLLIHLIASCIVNGTNELKTSFRTLAAEMKLTKEAVAVAARSLDGIIRVTASPGVPTTFLLPAEWFGSQRSLFTVPNVDEKRLKCPGFTDTSVLETRTLAGGKPGHSVLETRTPHRENQDTVSWKDIQLGGKPGHSVLETRTPATQNQQLTGGGGTIESIGLTGSSPLQSEMLDRIVRADHVPEIMLELSSVLSQHLRDYAHEHGPTRLAAATPDEVILARCFAIAPLGELITLLRAMHQKGTRTGDSYAWFVAVFANRIHGIKSEDLRHALKRHFSRRQPARERDPLFGRNLSAEVNQQAHSMR